MTINMSMDQVERMKALLERAKAGTTTTEMAQRIVDRGLRALEQEIRNRETTKRLTALGRAVDKDPELSRQLKTQEHFATVSVIK